MNKIMPGKRQKHAKVFVWRVVLLTAVSVLLLSLGFASSVQAQAGPEGIRSVLDLAVSPTPVVAGSGVVVNWTGDVLDTGTVIFRVYIPADWYNQTDWQAGNGVSASTLTGATYGVSACNSLTIGGVSTICAQYSATDIGDVIEAIDLSFTPNVGATAGAGRPVRVTNNGGSGGTPNISTVYVTVQSPPPTPTTRYVADNSAACGSYTPCDTGISALQNAVNALPAGGGTIRVVGTHTTAGASIAKELLLEPVGSSATLLGDGATCVTDGGSFLEIDSADVTVQNLILDGSGASCSYGIDVGYLDSVGSLTLENATVSDMGDYGVGFYGSSSGLIRGNQFLNNNDVGVTVEDASVSLVMYANNFVNNNSGGYQAVVLGNLVDAAKNWWGSYSDPDIGPTVDDASSYSDGWERRLGAPVDSWAAGTDSLALGNAGLTGSGDAVIISFGRGSANAPFGNGIPPYVNRSCSDYYDFYALDNPTNWTVVLPVDTSPACVTNVRNYEVAFTIDPANYDAACGTANNPECWQRVPESAITVSGNSLIITGQDLSYTHIVAGDEEGLDPTAVSLQSFGSPSGFVAWPLVVGLILLFGVALVVMRRRQA